MRPRSRQPRSPVAWRQACAVCALIASTCCTCISLIAPHGSKTRWKPWANWCAAGTVGHIGVSNYASWQIGELQAGASAAGLPKVEMSQPLYNLLARRIEQEYVEYSTAAGLINIVYNPLGGGLLTGKHHLDQDADHSSRFGADNPLSAMYRERYWNSRLFEAVSTLQAAASDCGLTLVETALRWLLSRESVAAVIVGASRMDHLMANIKAVEGPPLPQEILDVCDRVWSELDGPAPAYNR